MFKNSLYFLSAALVGFFLFVTVYLLLHVAQSTYPTIPQTQFSISHAPTDALIGNLATLSGQVLWESRTASTPSAITKVQPIQQGELLQTKDKGVFTLSFQNVLLATASAKGAINIIQTLPANMVLQQQDGKISYEVLGTKIPVSIRAIDLLINLTSGKSSIEVDNKKSQVTIDVLSGSITLAYTDTNNTSVVKKFSAGQEISFNNNTKTIKLL